MGLSRALHRNWLEARLGWSLIWRYKVCSPSDLIESVDGCRLFERFWKVNHRIRPKLKSDGTNLRAPSDLTETANGWKILARQELRMSNPRPRQELVQEHAGQNSELPADNRYNKHSCPNRYMKQWKGLLRVTQ